jgi:hypothetical protein
VNVEAYVPGILKITWDGNPSFPNETTYTEHPQEQDRIHNERELPNGGFTDANALSPDLVGSPFPKPEGGSSVVRSTSMLAG